MPIININISDEEQRLLADEYKKMSIDWLRSKPATVPPAFEDWLGARVTASARQATMSDREVEEIRCIGAIEKLITSLRPHGFGLAQLGKRGAEPAECAEELALGLVAELGLSRTRAKRVQELLEYYSKSAREIADQAQVSMTNRTYGALHEAYRELVERTARASAHLGEDKALGRVEGAVAMLVSLNVMNRQTAKEKTEAFKQQAREQDT